jgi:hypothetical protein
MARDERARHELFLRLEQVVGRESAETLMEMLPLRFELVDQRFEASENKLLAAFRAELLAQLNVISAQTRALIKANLGTVLSMAALAFAVAKLT